MSYRAAALVYALLVIAPAVATGQESRERRPTPISERDLTRMLVSGTYARDEIAGMIRRACLSFVPTATEQELYRGLGAERSVLSAIDDCLSRPAPLRAQPSERPTQPSERPPATFASPALPTSSVVRPENGPPEPSDEELASSLAALPADTLAAAREIHPPAALPADMLAAARETRPPAALPADMLAAARETRPPAALPADTLAAARETRPPAPLPADTLAAAREIRPPAPLPADTLAAAREIRPPAPLPVDTLAAAREIRPPAPLPVDTLAAARETRPPAALPADMLAAARETRPPAPLPAADPRSTGTSDEVGRLRRLAAAATARGDIQTTLRIRRVIVSLAPADPLAWFHLGAALASAGDGDEARAAFIRASTLDRAKRRARP